MSNIVNTDLSVLGTLTLVPTNATGNVLTLDGTNIVRQRTPAQLADDGADKNYVHSQGAAASVWNIAHNLNKKPTAAVVDSGGTVVIGVINYIDNNNITITFNASFSGEAYIN